MLASRGGNGSRYWLAAVTFFCTFYWILKAERHAYGGASSWKSRFYSEVPASSMASHHRFAEDEDQALPQAEEIDFVPISKAHPQSKSPLSDEFPKFIWQTSNAEGVERWANATATWTKKNPEWDYNLLTDEGATAFVYENFRHRPSIVQFWSELQQIVLKADLIRYLAMLARGGVYSDMDTSCLIPVDDWIPPELRNETINAVVGIEYDDTTYHMFVRPISFNQWTLLAKPGHTLFETAVRRVMSNLEYIARRKRVQLRELKLDKMEVLEATGPGMITDAVMEVLKDQVENIRWETFRRMKKPKIFGDVLVLPVRAFAGGQKHSHSSDKSYGPALVQHHFGRSWYRPQTPSFSPEVSEKTVGGLGNKTSEIATALGAERTSKQIGEDERGMSEGKGEQVREGEIPDEAIPERTAETVEKLNVPKTKGKLVEEEDQDNEGDLEDTAESNEESVLGEDLTAGD